MIAHIMGMVAEKFQNSCIVDVHGVGYEITLSAIDFEKIKLGDKLKLYTYHVVRENTEELFGFRSLAAKKLFELLITVNGIGPKAAMSILSLAAPEDVRNAIANADATFVSKAAGIGKKSAERVIVDLRDKVGVPSHHGTTDFVEASALAGAVAPDEALDALIALGFPLKEASMALEKVDRKLPVAERVREALRQK